MTAKRPNAVRLSKRRREARVELRLGKAMILGAARLDLDGAHEGSNTSGGRPVKSAQQTVDEAGAIRIAWRWGPPLRVPERPQ